jgi:hypothetical protein
VEGTLIHVHRDRLEDFSLNCGPKTTLGNIAGDDIRRRRNEEKGGGGGREQGRKRRMMMKISNSLILHLKELQKQEYTKP